MQWGTSIALSGLAQLALRVWPKGVEEHRGAQIGMEAPFYIPILYPSFSIPMPLIINQLANNILLLIVKCGASDPHCHLYPQKGIELLLRQHLKSLRETVITVQRPHMV